MKALKEFSAYLFLGAILGLGVFAWFSPSLIVWYSSPPGSVPMNCDGAVEWAIYTYRKILIVGIIFGMALSVVLFVALKKRKPAQVVPNKDAEPSKHIE
ncbi:MAG: hypothetical protein M9962_04365 [Oligoflexia bacterium]|nr:hypothetical protein [Oligoflexia bacterium]